MVRLDECTEIVAGGTPKTSVDSFWGGHICWATPKDLGDLEGTHISDTPRKLTQAGLKNSAARLLPPNSVLFSSRAPIGHVALNTVPMATNQGFKSFIPKQHILVPGFLYWWLRTNRTFLESLGNGATFKEVSKSVVSRIEIPLPPLPEQRRIAEVLDRAENLRVKRRYSISQLESLLQGVFIEYFERKNAKEWQLETIGDVVHPDNGSIRTGPFGSQLLTSEFVDSGIAVLGIDNVVTNEFRWGERRFITERKYHALKRYTVRPGDVLITIMGTCGRCAVVPDDIPIAINTKHLCCITLNPKKCLPVFLHEYFLRHSTAKKYLENRAKGAIMAGLNMGLIEAMPILLPPMEVQKEFARRIAAVEKLKAAHRASLAEHDALFASLQHRAFRGDL